MDYEKRYKEALEKAKEWEKRYILTNTISPDGTMAKEFKEIFPELAESEDERIRRAIIELLKEVGQDDTGVSENVKCMLAWLEKQKENPKSADSIPADCVSDAKCEDRSPKHTDSFGTDIRDTPAYWRGWDDAMKQKEQKPVDYDHEMWKNCEANFEGGKNEVIEHPEKYGLQKPAEWSEEDENNLDLVIDCIYEFYPDPVQKYKLKDWLNSLRNGIFQNGNTHWKPSEEQMEALESAVKLYKDTHYEMYHERIVSLYEHLKKLM